MSAAEPPRPPSRARLRLIRLVLFALVIVFVYAVGEAVTRLFVPEAVWRSHGSNDDWLFDEQLGWIQKPNLDISRKRDESIVRFRTNADGVTPETARRDRTPGVTRIMLFGDSNVVGRWVPPHLAIHAQLQRRLVSRGVVADVVNAGVEGYSTDQALLLMERLLPLYRPDIVAYGLHPNDLGGIVSPEAYGNAKPMFSFAPDGSLEVRPPPYRQRRILPRETASSLRRLVQRSALYRVFQPFGFRLRARILGFDQQTLHGIDWEIVYYRPEALERYDWRLLGALVDRMDETSLEHGAAFFFYHHPDLGAVWAPFIETLRAKRRIAATRYDPHALERRLATLAASRQVRFCPVVDRFAANQERGPFHLLPRDYHCNPAGYELTAELIADFLEQERLLGEPSLSGRPATPFAAPAVN